MPWPTDPEWHAKPIKERVRDMVRENPNFASFSPDQQEQILNNVARKYGKGRAGQPPSGPKEGLLEGAGKDISIGWRSGWSDVAHAASNLTKPVLPVLSKELGEYSREKAPRPEEVAGRTSIPSQVLQGVGAAVPTIVKYAPAEVLGKYAPLGAAAIGAVSKADEGWESAAKEAAKQAATFGVLGKTSKLPTRSQRALGGAAASGAITGVFEGPEKGKEIAASAIMGGAFSGLTPTKPKSVITPEQAKSIYEAKVNAVAKAKDSIMKHIAPQLRGPQGERESLIIRANQSDVSQHTDIAVYALDKASKEFRYMKDPERIDTMYAIEHWSDPEAAKDPRVTKAKENPQMKEFVETMRSMNDTVRDELIEESKRKPQTVVDKKTGKMEDIKGLEAVPTVMKSVYDALHNPDAAMRAYYLDYFPHLTKDPETAAGIMEAFYAGRRPASGPGTFTHERYNPTVEHLLYKWDKNASRKAGETVWERDAFGDRVPSGLELVTTDPVQSYLLKWREMKRYTAALRIAKENEAAGMLEWLQPGKRKEGWRKVEDKAFRRWRWEKDKDGHWNRELVSEAWMPEQAAQVLNNFLSPGLRRIAPIRGLLQFNNVLNQMQLGMSGFHLGFTSADVLISKFALGLEQSWEGLKKSDPKMVGKGLMNIGASTPIAAPITIYKNLSRGYKIREQFRKPDPNAPPEIKEIVQSMKEGNMGLGLDPIYKTDMTSKYREAIRQGNKVWSAWRLPFVINEKLANVIMEQVVPLQKIGVFADLAANELRKLPEGYSVFDRRKAMAKVADSVDNRMGMLRYDNLFWNNAIKDLAMLSYRSVGWNLGTLREIGFGAGDIGKFATKGELSHRLAYTAALPFVTGMIGGTMHYLFNGKPPEEPLDYLFPRTGRLDEFGRPNRISVPSYLKDLFHFYEAGSDISAGAGAGKLTSMIAAKLHPTWTIVANMLNNQDFYGTMVANSDDPLMKRMHDTMNYALRQATPFSVTNIQKQRKLGAGPGELAGTLFGFIPAPSDIKKTRAERMASEMRGRQFSQSPRTPEERERQELRRDLERRVRMNDNWQYHAMQALREDRLTENEIVHSLEKAGTVPFVMSVKNLPLQDLVRVYKFGTDQEQATIKTIIAYRLEHNPQQFMRVDKSKKPELAKQLHAILFGKGAQ
jgi:hypothetical protein